MRLFACRITDFNYTLIPYTDREIVKAARHFFPETKDHFFGADQQSDLQYLKEMHEACLAAEAGGPPMFPLSTVGKLALHDVPFKVEQKRISYFSDAPYRFREFITPMPSGSTATYSDRSFKQFFQDVGWDVNAVFCPHGGPVQARAGKDISARKYPISFVGRISLPNPLGAFETLLAGSDPRLIDIVSQASQLTLHENVEVYQAFRQSAQAAGFDPLEIMDFPVLCELLSKMGEWAEDQQRLSLLREFKDFPLHIFGPIRDEIKDVTDRPHHFYGPTLGRDVLAVLRESRILINSVTQFPEGSHERIWYAMAHGCLPYTDPSRYVSETFQHGKNILFIDYQNIKQSVAETIALATEEIDQLQNMINAALPIYKANHTWIHRLEHVFRETPDLAPFMPD